MRKRGIGTGVIVLALLVIAWTGLDGRAAATDRHVVLVSLDGFPAAALEDPRLPTPTLRRLIREGAVARRLRPVNPTVTWPNHTTMVTGVAPARHGVLFNGILVRSPGRPTRIEPWRDKREMVQVPTLYDAAFAAGLTTAQVDWVAIQNPGTITWAFPERPDPTGAIEQELIAKGLVTAEQLATFGVRSSAAWRDQVWTDAAVHILRQHRPNLLLYHLLSLDSTHHKHGPGTPEAAMTMAYVDGQLGRVIRAIEESALGGRTTVLVVSDHGFRRADRTIQPNVALRDAGLVRGSGAELAADVWVKSWGGTAGVYVQQPDRREELLAAARPILERLEGVERVITPSEYAAYGWPSPDVNGQMADLVLAARDGYDFGDGFSPEVVKPADPAHRGHHGVLAADPSMDALFVAWGLDVSPGVVLDEARTLDLAATMAEWLDLRYPTDGTSLAPRLRR